MAKVIRDRGKEVIGVGVGSAVVVRIGDTEQVASTVELSDCTAGFFELITRGIGGDDPFLPGFINPVAAAVILEYDIPAAFLHQIDSARFNDQMLGEGCCPAITQSSSGGALTVIGSGEGEGSPWPGEADIGCREIFIAGPEVDLVGGEVGLAGGQGADISMMAVKKNRYLCSTRIGDKPLLVINVCIIPIVGFAFIMAQSLKEIITCSRRMVGHSHSLSS